MVSGYGLDDRAVEVRFPAEEKDFSFSLCIQTGSGAHPAQWVSGVLSLGLTCGRGVTLTTHAHLVLRLRMSGSYTSCRKQVEAIHPLPPSASVACSGTALAFINTVQFDHACILCI
jgi:hypothetical protein